MFGKEPLCGFVVSSSRTIRAQFTPSSQLCCHKLLSETSLHTLEPRQPIRELDLDPAVPADRRLAPFLPPEVLIALVRSVFKLLSVALAGAADVCQETLPEVVPEQRVCGNMILGAGCVVEERDALEAVVCPERNHFIFVVDVYADVVCDPVVVHVAREEETVLDGV